MIGLPQAQKIALQKCDNHRNKIAEFKIVAELEPTRFFCKHCYQSELNSGRIRKAKEIYSEEKLDISSHIPEALGKGIRNFSKFGWKYKKEKELTPDQKVYLGFVWDYATKNNSQHVKIFGGTLDAIRIMDKNQDDDYLWIYFTESGIPLFSTDLVDEFVEYYAGNFSLAD